MNLLDLFVKLGVDDSEVDEKFDTTRGKAESLASKLQGGLATAAKVGAAAITATAGAVTALTKKALDSYGEYEQLVGGVETLFKTSADVVQQYADNAYKTAGMSANEYMTTVTAFSASLLQSMGNDTDAAAEKANLAITDMSDNANKMGSSMESIQNAYSGFAKQNYTMLDNLKLGYGGTQAEMQRLLNDANALNAAQGNYTNYSIDSYADIVDAIHTVQTEMGITGTTALEASTTIQGSVNSLKSAWRNLVTGIADENADLGELVGNVVDSAATAAGNIVPRIEQILTGMGTAITKITPVLSEQLPQMISSVLPTLLSSAISLAEGILNGVVAALPSLLQTAVDALPQLAGAALSIISNLANALVESAPLIFDSGMDLLSQLTSGIESGLPDMLERLPAIITGFIDFCAENFPKIIDQGYDLLIALMDGIISAIPTLLLSLPQIIEAIVNYLVSVWPTMIKKGAELLGHFIAGIIGAIGEIKDKLPEVVTAVVDTIGEGWADLKELGSRFLEGLWEGISDKIGWLKGKVSGVVDKIKGWFTDKDGFDTHSPSKWFESIGEYMMQGLSLGMENSKGQIMDTVDSLIDEVKTRFNDLADTFTLRQDISDLEYQIWEARDGDKSTETEKYAKKLQLLEKQEQDQKSIVEAAAAAYEKVIEQYGESSKESYEYQKTLLQEQLQYQKLLNSINEVKEARNSFYKTAEGRIDFAQSIAAKTSAAAVNAISSMSGTQNISLAANLTLENGAKVASWLLPSLVKSAAAAGTPITNPQTA